MLYLPEYVNRAFRLLKELRKRISCRLVLLANVGCLLHSRNFHIQAISHCGKAQQLGAYVDYSLMWCTSEKVVECPRRRPTGRIAAGVVEGAAVKNRKDRVGHRGILTLLSS